jgi:hypothetical protein
MWCGSVCEFADENLADPVEDAVNDAADWIDDSIVDPIQDTASDVWDFATSAAEDLWNNVQDFQQQLAKAAEKLAGEIEEKWEEFTAKTTNLLADLWEGLDKAWDGLVNTLEEWGQWVKEQVDSAAEWLAGAAEAVLRYVVDEILPWVVSVIKLPWVIAEFLGGLLALAVCWIASRFTQPEEVKVIQAITDHHPRTLEDFRIARLPVEQKYVVFSDVHMFVNGDFNFYQNNRNSEIHQSLLSKYAQDGYRLIDNGDVEDFWMRGGSARGHILDVADMLPFPFYYEAYGVQAALGALQAHAANIFRDNSATYGLVNQLYVASGGYARTIGNHDDVWSRDDMAPLFDLVYQAPVVANDYILLDDSSTGETKVVIAHGHQSDIWNMELCNFAGKAVTDAFSTLTEVSLGLVGKVKKFYRAKSEWQSDLAGRGFDDELHRMEGLGLTQSLDEVELHDQLERVYGDSPRQPYLILGHTHDVKDDAGVPDWMYSDQWTWREYSNTGTTGMWEELVVCTEVQYPDVRPVAWYLRSDGSLQREDLSSYTYGDVYLK